MSAVVFRISISTSTPKMSDGINAQQEVGGDGTRHARGLVHRDLGHLGLGSYI